MLDRLYQGNLTKSQRQDIVDEYKASQQKTVNINPGRNVNFSKGDPLNKPKHKVLHYCSAFEECPLCYKCRSYDSSHMACRDCVLAKEGSLCKRELHTPQVLANMIRRERIDLDGNMFRVFYMKMEDGMGFIQKVVLPGGQVILFDHEEGNIDFEPMRPYISFSFEYFVNGKSKGKKVLEDIGINDDGIKYIKFDVGDDPDADKN